LGEGTATTTAAAEDSMSEYSWIRVKQDLKTLVCARCGQTHTLSINLPAPMNEYLTVLRAGEEAFTAQHKDCQEQEDAA
jgi:transcription elongation factor Elf1